MFSRKYYTLLGSLPALPRHFEEAERVPISRYQLSDRLRMLEPVDADEVKRLTDFLVWERQPMERTDANVVAHYFKCMETLNNQFARNIVQRAMNVRLVIAALRMRRLGMEPPVSSLPLARHIETHWGHPEFKLAAQYPWLAKFESELKTAALRKLELMKLEVGWSFLSRRDEQFQFTLDAVIVYLAKWEIVCRWTERDAVKGNEKFEQLVADAMGPNATLFD